MIMTRSFTRRGVLLAMAVGSMGCGSAARSGVAPTPPPKPTDLELTDNVENMLKQPGTFRAFIANGKMKLGKPGQDYVVQQPGKCDATLRITPYKGVKQLSKDDHFYDSPSGFVLAKLENVSPTACTFEEYGLAAGHTAYWVVDAAAYGQLRSHFIDVGASGSTPDEVALRPDREWTFENCPHSHGNSDDVAAIAARKDLCTKLGVAERTAVDTVLVPATPAGSPRSAGDDTQLWITCAQGCCYADSRAI